MAMRETARLFLVKQSYIHKTRTFSKTHLLILAMEGADKERNRLLLVKHTHMHNTRPFSKTNRL